VGVGGKRPGAGRKPGIPNRATIARQAEVAASGQTPLDYMLGVMRDKKADKDRRDRMAAAVAPYVHPKLSAVDHSGSLTLTLEDMLDAIDGPEAGGAEEAEG
jgi:hypothetical protein